MFVNINFIQFVKKMETDTTQNSYFTSYEDLEVWFFYFFLITAQTKYYSTKCCLESECYNK